MTCASGRARRCRRDVVHEPLHVLVADALAAVARTQTRRSSSGASSRGRRRTPPNTGAAASNASAAVHGWRRNVRAATVGQIERANSARPHEQLAATTSTSTVETSASASASTRRRRRSTRRPRSSCRTRGTAVRQARHEQKRQEHHDESNGGRDDCGEHLVVPLSRPPTVDCLSPPSRYVLEHDDRVVHDQADRHTMPSSVSVLTENPPRHHAEGADYRHRNRITGISVVRHSRKKARRLARRGQRNHDRLRYSSSGGGRIVLS